MTGGARYAAAHLERRSRCTQPTFARGSAALVEQAFLGSTRVSCPIGPVVAISKWKGQLRVMVRGWGRWYPVEHVSIERRCVARRVEDRAEGSVTEKTCETRISSVERVYM